MIQVGVPESGQTMVFLTSRKAFKGGSHLECKSKGKRRKQISIHQGTARETLLEGKLDIRDETTKVIITDLRKGSLGESKKNVQCLFCREDIA